MLSAWSPVISAKSIAARLPSPCCTGLAPANRFIWRIDQSMMNGCSASWGRHAEAAKPDGSCSVNSTRAGDSSSASWKSVSWPK